VTGIASANILGYIWHMTAKPFLLQAVLCLSILTARSQTPERMLINGTSNLKEPSPAAVEMFNKGSGHLNKKEYPQAIRYFERAVALDSSYIDAYNNLGLIFYETDVYDSATHYLLLSLQRAPNNTAALQNMALVQEKQGQLLIALSYYKKIIDVAPNDPEGYYNTARILATMGKLQESVAPAQQAEKLYAKAGNPAISDCHYMQFVIYYNLHDKVQTKKYRELCKKENMQIPADMQSDPN